MSVNSYLHINMYACLCESKYVNESIYRYIHIHVYLFVIISDLNTIDIHSGTLMCIYKHINA